jgi:L-lactate dehydrogenase (cytochrome)
MFLLYLYRDRDLVWELIERCKRARYAALCLMVDVPVIGKRERDLRTGFSTWPNWSFTTWLRIMRHPAWAVGQLRKGPITLANFAGHGRNVDPAQQLDPSATWDDVREIADRWGGPFALKGVMSPDDARRAADCGATAILVSNHGGRQLDGAAAPIDVLPEIARAVGERIEVILDGGDRRGVHVLKALALGARACSIGRPYLYGLGAGGEAGVARALEILRTELKLAMQLSGCASLASIDSSLVRRPHESTVSTKVGGPARTYRAVANPP